MTDLIVIKHRFTSLNAYINAERTNKYIASSIKKKETDLVVILVKNWMNEKKISQIEYPVFINFNWITPNEREDPDNICFAKKFILDGMVDAGLLKKDGRKQIKGFNDSFSLSDEYSVEINFCL